MPIVIDNTQDDGMEALESVELFDADGEATLEAEVITGFLEELDWDDVLNDEDVAEFVKTQEGFFKIDENGELVLDELGEPVEGKEGDKDVEECVIETLDGELAQLFVDEDDLFEMFRYYVANLPDETLEEKTRKAVFADILDEEDEDLEEKAPFKKGSFKKIHKRSGGPALVNRMLGAMLVKQAIKRKGGKNVSPKSGDNPFKSGSAKDYTKGAKYGGGTPGGRKRWKAYKTKKAAQLAKKEKKTRKAKKSAGLKAAPKKGAKKAGAKALAKKKGGGKKSMGASDTTTPPANLHEDKSQPAYPSLHMSGAALAGKISENLKSPEQRAQERKDK